MKPDPAVRQMNRGEQEAETEATRLIELIEGALAAVAVPAEIDTLESVADRIERASRDMVVAVRELAHERRIARKESQ
ncbi:MAG: hypothetical protein M3539_12355 [Acidobacteriota bacterium]|nr:hypothetical protein [Acidobacteriota bacterium]